MNYFPEKPEENAAPEPRLVEAEIVEDKDKGEYEFKDEGLPSSPPSFLKRLAARAALSLILSALGLALAAIGSFLTLTIIGAPLGIPLLVMGLLIFLIGLTTLFARRKTSIRVYGRRDVPPY